MSAETLESHARQLLEPQDGDGDSYDFYVKLVGPGAPMRLTTNAGRRLFAHVLTALILITPGIRHRHSGIEEDQREA